jgi:hypothetical protein
MKIQKLSNNFLYIIWKNIYDFILVNQLLFYLIWLTQVLNIWLVLYLNFLLVNSIFSFFSLKDYDLAKFIISIIQIYYPGLVRKLFYRILSINSIAIILVYTLVYKLPLILTSNKIFIFIMRNILMYIYIYFF